MALINCPECGKQISDKAAICINCGFPFLEKNNKENDNEIENNIVDKCKYCGSLSIDKMGYCDECGMKQDYAHTIVLNNSNIKKTDPYTICPKCNNVNKAGVFECMYCAHQYKIYEYVVHQPKVVENDFKGIYKYNVWGKEYEVYCPRCGSENCSHLALSKTTYTTNLNPLKPLTLMNKKEKYVNSEQIICNSCGYVFK